MWRSSLEEPLGLASTTEGYLASTTEGYLASTTEGYTDAPEGTDAPDRSLWRYSSCRQSRFLFWWFRKRGLFGELKHVAVP